MALLNCCRNSSGFTTMAMINPPESKLKKRTSVLCMEFKKKIRPKDFFWSVMKMTFTRNIPNMPQGQPNPWFRSIRVQNWDFLKKDSKDFKNSFQSGFLWIPNWRAKLESAYSLMVHYCKNTECVVKGWPLSSCTEVKLWIVLKVQNQFYHP